MTRMGARRETMRARNRAARSFTASNLAGFCYRSGMLVILAPTVVVCAPGYPGSTAEAQPSMDALARALARAAHAPEGSFAAVYEETEAGGVQRLQQKDAALVLATLPFFLAHEQELGLSAQLSAMLQSGDTLERWT